MSPAAQSVMPLLNSLSERERLEIAHELKRGLISDPKLSAADRKLLKRSLALKPRQRRLLADILSMLNHPPQDELEKLFQEILRMSHGLRFEVGWRLDESLPTRRPAPLSKQQIAELKRRIKEIDSGKAKMIPGEVVMAKLKAMQAKSRAKAEAKVAAARIDWSKKPRPGFVPAEDVLAKVRLTFSRRSKSRPPRK
ncbi:MAG: addiction module protein [Prosthecobacter sp.]|uniref:addiction module protein n=1 Tax=Prosthecobacter sp. TaxID=1965333 RepID=UPI0039040463